MHNVGIVPTFKMHNIGTVPTFEMPNIGTEILSKPQPNLNTRLGLTINDSAPPPPHRNSISAISQLLLTRF